jgi:cob(I)alamin adenosyltransferase
MPVNLTRIYTRTGDDGTTGLADFSRVPKTDVRLAATADCDETNAALGVVLAVGRPPAPIAAVVARVQHELFDLGADLSTPVAPYERRADGSIDGQRTGTTAQPARLRIERADVDALEADCDRFNDDLPPLRSFVLPGGAPAAALLHVARTVARRAERTTWALLTADPERTNPVTATYLNRLSDLLFILARAANDVGDVLWEPGSTRAGRADRSEEA